MREGGDLLEILLEDVVPRQGEVHARGPRQLELVLVQHLEGGK